MPISRKLIFALVPLALLLAAAEMGARILQPADEERWLSPGDWGKFDVESEQLTFLPGSVRWNALVSPWGAPDPELLFRVQPNPTQKPVGTYVGIGPRGFRGAPFDPEDGRPQLVLLGDSCTFGFGHPNHHTSYAEILRARLPKWQVINLGQPGYSSAQGLRLLERELASGLRPAAAVIYFGFNDSRRAPAASDETLLSAYSLAGDPVVRLAKASRAFGAAVSWWRNQGQGGQGINQFRVPPADTVANIYAMMERLGSIPTVVVPVPAQGVAREGVTHWREKLHDNFEGQLVSITGEELVFLKDNYHPAPESSQLLAQRILDAFVTGEDVVHPLTPVPYSVPKAIGVGFDSENSEQGIVFHKGAEIFSGGTDLLVSLPVRTTDPAVVELTMEHSPCEDERTPAPIVLRAGGQILLESKLEPMKAFQKVTLGPISTSEAGAWLRLDLGRELDYAVHIGGPCGGVRVDRIRILGATGTQ